MAVVTDLSACPCCSGATPAPGCCNCCPGRRQRRDFLFTVTGSTNSHVPDGYYRLSLRDPLATPESGLPPNYACGCSYQLDYSTTPGGPWTHLLPWIPLQCTPTGGTTYHWEGISDQPFLDPPSGFYGITLTTDADATSFCINGGTLTLIPGADTTGAPATITLTPDGPILDCPDCCDCPCCVDGFWTDFVFTVTGINGTCGACSTLNGTWTLSYMGSCGWATVTPGSFCTGAGPYWVLNCSGGTWTLSSHTDAPLYTSADPDLCIDGGTLTLTGTPGICDTYPATITIAPAGHFVSCP